MIDLHLHSTASDGTDAPCELVQKAKNLGLEAIALTDHDTMDGLAEAAEAAHDLNINFVRGCEVSSSSEYGEMHILGLWLPENCPELKSFLTDMRRIRQERNDRILEKLRRQGIAISPDEVLAHATTTPGRPHMAAVLVEKGYAKDVPDAFARYLGSGGTAYVPKQTPPAWMTVKILHAAGATVAIAHPLLHDLPLDWLEDRIARLAGFGLSSLEAWHSAQDEAKTAIIVTMAKRLGLELTGGSDYHGNVKPYIRMGTGRGNLNVTLEVYARLLAWRKARGLP